MSTMFWVWLAVIVIGVVVEACTTDLISIWFSFGAIVPFILAGATGLRYEWQIVIFVVISAVLIVTLRKVTMKYLFKNSNAKTNLAALEGQKYRLLSRTDFETIGTVKINGVEWSVVSENRDTIEKDEVVEIIKVQGNKLVVKNKEEK